MDSNIEQMPIMAGAIRHALQRQLSKFTQYPIGRRKRFRSSLQKCGNHSELSSILKPSIETKFEIVSYKV